jgi:hypothetical protein
LQRTLFPIVALASKDITIDKDTNQSVANSYVLCLHAVSVTASTSGAVSGTVSNFISPMSTLIMEKIASNPAMSLTNAMTQLRNQMNLPVGINMMADYVAGSLSGTNAGQYQTMHTAAQQMAGIMSGQAGQVMNGPGVNVNRYRSMMGTINVNMPAIAANVANGQGMNSTLMTSMRSNMQTQLSSMPMSGGTVDYSSMFQNMTGHSSFWSNTGLPMNPMGSGGMMR